MTKQRDYFGAYPKELKASTVRSDHRCYRATLYFAVQGKVNSQPELRIVWTSPGDRITVFEGDPRLFRPASAAQRLRAVYQFPPSGPPLVPTGLVFARFEEGSSAEDKRQQIVAAGYDIDSIPSYATHCAWLKAIDGRVSSALGQIREIEALPGIVNVEPQLVGPHAQR